MRTSLLLLGLLQLADAAPAVASTAVTSSSYWLANVQRQGTVAFGDSSFKIYRNVQDYGAKGDGSTDDTVAINNAITAGNRCGSGCDSSTVTPALVYFPPGTYLVSSRIIQYYYTQLVGDAVHPPTIKASANFQGLAVIDSDPYYPNSDVNWFQNQNNFFRQIRNFVIDLTAMPSSTGSGIHWQVAQATSLQNIRFEMVRGGGSANKQNGINMDNGSGGFFSDLTFNGGNYGAFLGNQQFTTRNLTFNGCNTAIFMNWNWAWSLKSVSIQNCGVGIDITNTGSVGSVLLLDSTISNTPVGIKTSFTQTSTPNTGGTLIIDNVDFSSCPAAVQSDKGTTILAGGSVVKSWAQGRHYTGANGARIQTTLTPPVKPAGLLNSAGHVFERSKPQYENYPASAFVSVKSKGAKGDGVTDDTAAIQAAMNSIGANQILYFDHGAYIISNTVKVPKNIKITGEIWPLIMAKGSVFQNQNSPVPVFQVGQPGDVGSVEISDLIFETVGPQPGAILMQWNLAGSSQGASGMWDTHFRIGGSAGTQLQSNTCAKNPSVTAAVKPACIGAYLLLHVTSTGSVYVENSWFWVADHELDLADHNQINIFNGRGVLVESQKAVWMYGTSSEHSVLYNYQINNAKNVFMSMIQSETPYFQSNPDALTPFAAHSNINDPTFTMCAQGDELCKKAWGLRVINSQDVLIYGAGLYSFFDNVSPSPPLVFFLCR